MLGLLIAVALTSVIAFVVYVLFFDTKTAAGTSLDDFIEEDDGKTKHVHVVCIYFLLVNCFCIAQSG